MQQARASGQVLIVDDNREFQASVADLATLAGCAPACAATLAEARGIVHERVFDLLLLDLDLPDGNGLELLDSLDLPSLGQVVVITGHPSFDTAVRAVRLPVFDYLVKPVAPGVLDGLFAAARDHAARRVAGDGHGFAGMIGQAESMQELFAQIRRAAVHDVNVLIEGESGTGKELVARAVHDCSGRTGAFVAFNCAAVSADLLGSQLFGHERGAFTGAVQAHEGLFERADGGTLFLDEITEMPVALQSFLLRVLETRTVTRVGGTREFSVDVRVIAASNRELGEAMATGRLREDLYYRLAEFPLRLAPLRERPDDVPLLAAHFLERLNRRYRTRKVLPDAVMRELARRTWPGNVRELRHLVQRAYILSPGDELALPPREQPRAVHSAGGAVQFQVGMTFDQIEREMLLKTLAFHNNNKRETARSLGVTTKTVYNRLQRYREEGFYDDDIDAGAD